MNDGSAGSSLQSLREFSSANSEFELVDVVGSRLSSVRSKQPSSVDVFWSSTSPAVHSPVLSNLKFDHQSSTLKEGNGHCEIHENEQKSPNEMDILLENKRLRAELAEAKVQLIAMSKEIETYRQTMREGLSKKNEGLSKAMEEMQTVDKSLAEPRQWKNGSKTSSMCVGLGSMLQQSEFENSKNLIGQCFDKGTAKAKQRPMPSPLTCNSKTALCVLRSTSSPPLPKFSPPRNVADAQLLDLLGSVQPMRDANRPAAPPPKKNSWCKLCGEWLCNSYFLRAHIQSQHATHGENDKENGPKSGKKHQNALDFEEVTVSPNSIHCSAVDAELVIEKALFDSDSSQRLIDINGESQSAVLNKVVRPKPIRPVPSGKFQIKWEEEDEETDEEKLMNGAKNHSSWSLIGQLTDEGRNGKTDTEKKLTNELSKYDGYENVGQQKKKQQMDLSSPIAHSFPSSVTSSSVSPFVSHFRSLSSERKLQQQLCSSSSSSDSALSSSTASSTMSSPNNTSEDEGLSYGLRRERNAQEEQNEMHNSKLDDSILNRLLHIDPPNNTNKQKSSNEISHSYVSDNENAKATETRGVERDDLLGEDFKKFDYDIGNELSKLRNDFHSLHFLHENTHRQTNQRLYILENRMAELNVQLKTFDTQTETVRGEHKIQMANLVLENGRLCQEFGQQQKGLKAVQSRIELLEHCHLRAFVARLPPVFEDGSLVLSQFEKGIYCAELKMLFKSGARFCSGLAIKGSAHFRNYPANLFNQLIEHALTTRHVQKMIRWTVLNFPTDEKCPWPQVLLSLGDICTANGSNDTDDRNNDNSKLYIYRNWVRKRAVLSDRVVYSLLNQHSSHKFVVNIYYSSDAELFKRMHCFTIRRHRPSLGI